MARKKIIYECEYCGRSTAVDIRRILIGAQYGR